MKAMKLTTLINFVIIFAAIIFYTPLLNQTIKGSVFKSIIIGLFAGGCIFTVGKLKSLEGKDLPMWLGVTIMIGLPVAAIVIEVYR